MEFSNDCVQLVKDSEAYRAYPYRHPGDVWTNGWGNTHGVTALTPAVTEEQAEADLERNLQEALSYLQTYCTAPLWQGAVDALCDFIFNEGVGHFVSSTLLTYLNAGRYQAAAGEFGNWVYADHVKLPGLVTRRVRERALFLQGLPPDVA